MAKTPMALTFDSKGPFFKNKPGATFRQNAARLIAATAEHGRTELVAKLRSGEGSRALVRVVSPPRVAAHITVEKRTRSSKPDEIVSTVKVDISGTSAKQAIALRAAASEIERRERPGRQTAAQLRSSNKLNARELLKGIDG